jgi:hypothetical protein
MDGNGAFLLFGGLEELLNDVWRGNSSVRVVQVDVVDASFLEDLLIVLRLVESDNERNSELLEDGNVVLRREGTVFVMYWNWS